MTFESDLKIGNQYEDIFCNMLGDIGFKVQREQGYFPDWDIISEDGLTWEVKYDKYSIHSNNVAIEYMCGKNLSGISVTKAMFWSHFYYDSKERLKVNTVRVDVLKDFIKENINVNRWIRTVANCGDGNASLILINKPHFETIGTCAFVYDKYL